MALWQRMAVGTVMLLNCACAHVDQTGSCEWFETSMKNYNKMLRWRELEQAGAGYMVPEQQEQFRTGAAELKKRDVTMTDFRILSSECDREKGRAGARVEFDYFVLPSNRVRTVLYEQTWQLQEGGGGWRLQSGLPGFE